MYMRMCIYVCMHMCVYIYIYIYVYIYFLSFIQKIITIYSHALFFTYELHLILNIFILQLHLILDWFCHLMPELTSIGRTVCGSIA